MTKSTGKKMGRPPLPPEKKRGQTMGFKPTPNIRKLLQEVAEWNGRSVSKEIEFRLRPYSLPGWRCRTSAIMSLRVS